MYLKGINHRKMDRKATICNRNAFDNVLVVILEKIDCSKEIGADIPGYFVHTSEFEGA
jgi:hypothetical protein